MKSRLCVRVFLRALLVILFVDGCSGQAGNCSYQYCTHTSTFLCSPEDFVRLQCVVYNAANIKWYHSQNENAMELNITTGDRYIANETSVPSGDRFQNCTGDNWRNYEITFSYNKSDSGFYWCQIVTAGNIQLELSIPWIVETSAVNFPNVTMCGTAGDTDPKCVVGPTATPTLSSTTVLAQDYSTSAVGTTVKPSVSATTMTHSPVETPSVPSSSTATPSTAPPFTDCTMGGTSCFVYLATTMTHSPVETPSVPSSSTATPSTAPSSPAPPVGCTVGGTSCFVYLGAGLGVLTVIVLLLIVIVIVLIFISVRRGQKKGKGKKVIADSDPKDVKSFEEIELQQQLHVVENTIYYREMKRHDKGSHKKKNKNSKSYEYVDTEPDMAQEDKRSSCKIHQIPAVPNSTRVSADKSTEEEMHMYDVVKQPVAGNAGSSDQQHIYSKTQHAMVKQQTRNECHQHVANGHEYGHLDSTKLGQKRDMRVGTHEYDQVSPGEQQRQLGSGDRASQEHLYHVLDGPAEISNNATNAVTTEDMYSTPNFHRSSSTGQPLSPSSQENFYHVLEDPATSTVTYSSPQISANSGKEEGDNEHDYDQPIHQNSKLKDKVDQREDSEVLFDDPSYLAPGTSAQPHRLSHNSSHNTKDKPILTSSEATPVDDQGKLIAETAYQVSTAANPARRLTASRFTAHSHSNQEPKKGKEENDTRDSTISPHAPKGEYDQPTAISAASKDSSSAEGDQSVLFDDPIYSEQI